MSRLATKIAIVTGAASGISHYNHKTRKERPKAIKHTLGS